MNARVSAVSAVSALAAATLLCWAAPASAHKLAPSLLSIEETQPGHFSVLWRTPRQMPRGAAAAEVRLPASCTALSAPRLRLRGTGVDRRWSVRCAGGLDGRELRVLNLSATRNAALLDMRFLDGRRFAPLLSAKQPAFTVPDRQPWTEVFFDYLALGAGHFASGWDHVLFLLALLLLIRDVRTLAWTITAFTLGHSLTLSLAVLDVIHWSSTFVEVAIALSVYALAAELLAARARLARHTAWVAVAFGLLHGLGFAGALRELGLPADAIALSLFSFNLGIECGQLAMALPVALACHWGRQRFALKSRAVALRASAYVIGTAASFWLTERTLAWWLLEA